MNSIENTYQYVHVYSHLNCTCELKCMQARREEGGPLVFKGLRGLSSCFDLKKLGRSWVGHDNLPRAPNFSRRPCLYDCTIIIKKQKKRIFYLNFIGNRISVIQKNHWIEDIVLWKIITKPLKLEIISTCFALRLPYTIKY